MLHAADALASRYLCLPACPPAVAPVGTVGTAVASPAADSLPPSPPAAWAAMEKDCQLVFNVEIRGKYIIPFTR